MLRSWMSQWSPPSPADGERCARNLAVPLLAIEPTADDAVPQPDVGLMYEACGSKDKAFRRIADASHYFKGRPERLKTAVALIDTWSAERNG